MAVRELKFKNFFVKENGEILEEKVLSDFQKKEIAINFTLNQKRGYERAGYTVTEVKSVLKS